MHWAYGMSPSRIFLWCVGTVVVRGQVRGRVRWQRGRVAAWQRGSVAARAAARVKGEAMAPMAGERQAAGAERRVFHLKMLLSSYAGGAMVSRVLRGVGRGGVRPQPAGLA